MTDPSRWHEQDPLELLQTVETCVEKAVEEFVSKGHDSSRIRSIGITNQRETIVLWDKYTGEPLYNAVVWPDTRTASLVRELKTWENADKLQDLCGLPLSTYPSSVKLMWVLQNVDAVKEAYNEGRLAFGTVDSWLIYRLNGGNDRPDGPVHVTDSTNASRTMFMNIHKLEYDDTLLSFFKLDRSKIKLPKIVPSSHSTAFGSLYRGPLKGVPIAGCLGDQSSALVGQCGFSPGQAKNTYGTGCFLLYNVGTKPVISKNGLLATVAFDFGEGREPMYALEGSIAVGGSGVTFLQSNIGLIQDSKDIDQVAKTVPDNGGVYFVTAFSGLFAPYWIDDAKGTMCTFPMIVCLILFPRLTNIHQSASPPIPRRGTSPALPSRPSATRPLPSSTPWPRTRVTRSSPSPSTAASPTRISACRPRPTSAASRLTAPLCARPPPWAPPSPRASPRASGRVSTTCAR